MTTDFAGDYTLSTAAIRLGVTRQQVHNLLTAGTLAGEQFTPYPGARPIWRIARESVEHYAEHRPKTGRPRKPPA